MANQKWEEIILAASRASVFENEELTFQGTETNEVTVNRIINNIAKSCVAVRRGNDKDSTPKENNAEINLDLLQPIPYAVIRRKNELFVYERLSGGGEARLHNKLSLGAGGHMNPEEMTVFDEILKVNLERELEEELDIEDKNMEITPVGLINDDSDEVNKVHIGILLMIDVAEDSEVTVRETDQLRGFWASIDELRQPKIYVRLETWSKIVVDIL